MSTAPTTDLATGSRGAGSGEPRPGWRGRLSVPHLVVAAVVLAALGAVLLLGQRTTGNTTPLDPANPRPEGARALARVLAAEGVEVTVARGRDELTAAEVDATTTVVVTSADELGPSTITHLRRLTAGRTVLVQPTAEVARGFGGSADPVGTDLGDPVRGSCRDSRFDGLRLYAESADTYLSEGCFRTGQGRSVLVTPSPGVELFGAGAVLANRQVTAADNAAVALRLLGSTPRLVWYVPDSSDLPADEHSGLGEALPDWLVWVLRLLAVTAVTLLVWRVRRFGPLAVEPLPVHVRAVEATVGRGRSYRRSGDRTHVAAVLRAGERRRIADLLAVDRHDHEAVVRAVAARTDRTHDEVWALLAPDAPAPTTDAALVRLAQELAALTEEVRQP